MLANIAAVIFYHLIYLFSLEPSMEDYFLLVTIYQYQYQYSSLS